ncbi:hypothetical protein IQ252_01615 [Tychonema sp. LEGE 07203]|nr:hypothetical protein [Tychonema sp. LEGE 07203]
MLEELATRLDLFHQFDISSIVTRLSFAPKSNFPWYSVSVDATAIGSIAKLSLTSPIGINCCTHLDRVKFISC